MPGYGIAAVDEGSGLLPWAVALDRLSTAHDYWVATVRPDGRPHLMAVWGVVLDDRLTWSTSPTSRKALNLGANASVTVSTDGAARPVIVEGRAVLVDDPHTIERFASAMNAKYDASDPVDFYAANRTFAVVVERAFALDTADFTGSPTRWEFPAG